MKTFKLFILLYLFLPFTSTSLSKESFSITKLESSTEAGFSFDCPHCEESSQLPLQTKSLKCLQTIYSKACRSVPEKDRKTCTGKDNLKIQDTSSLLAHCLKETILSFQLIFDLLWYGITASTSWIFDSEEDNSSSQNYIYIEFFKAYTKAKGSKLERALKAAELVGKEAFSLIWSHVKDFLITEYNTLKCYNQKAQATMGCVFIAGLLMPIPGSSFLAIIKPTAKIGAKLIKQPKTTSRHLKKSMQINSIKAHIRSQFDQIQKKVLKKSKKLSKSERNQVLQFFKSVDKNKLTNLIERRLQNMKTQALSREGIRNSIIASLAVGSAYTIQLSPRVVTFVGEEITNHIAYEYFYKEVL